MRIPRHLCTSVIFSLFFVLCSGSIHADMDMQILPWADGYHKYGRWLPLRITLTSVDEDMAGEVTVEMQDSTTGARQIYSTPVTLFKAARKVQYLYVLPESFRRNLSVKLMDSRGEEVMQKEIALVAISPEDLLVAVVARSGGGLEYLADIPASGRRLRGEDPERDTPSAVESGLESARTYVSYSTAELLPDKWKGYDSVGMIVLGDISADALSADQRKAITDWVYGGGTLVVSGGAHSQDLAGTFVEEILPVRVNGTRVLDSIPSSLSKLAAYSASRQFGEQIGRTRMVVASSELTVEGRAIASENDGLPIVAEREVGNGRVVFLAFSYLDPAFRAWSGKREMWEKLQPQSIARKSPRDADVTRLLSASRPAKLPSYKFAGIFLLSYILCFGPLNYLILRRSNRGEWTWIAMPAITAVFVIGAVGFTYAVKSRAVVVNELSVMDIYQGVRRARINSYFGLFSPAASDYSLEFPAPKAMFVNRARSPDRKTHQYGDCRLVERGMFRVEILQIGSLSPQFFYGESYIDLDKGVSVNLAESSEGITHGELVSNLPFDLTDCYFFSKGRYTYVGDLASEAHAQIRLDRIYSGDIFGLYTTRAGEKRRFIDAMKPSLARRAPSTGLIGWMAESALKTLIEMNMGEGYEALGTTLIIMHL